MAEPKPTVEELEQIVEEILDEQAHQVWLKSKTEPEGGYIEGFTLLELKRMKERGEEIPITKEAEKIENRS